MWGSDFSHFRPEKQVLTRPVYCDKLVVVNGVEGNKYSETLCPERPRLVKEAAEQQGKYLPELQAECILLLVGCAACERYKRRSVTLLWGVHS